MKSKRPKVLFFLVGISLPANVFASVVINEIAWMGSPPEPGETTQEAANDEWIELYNFGNTAVDITGWLLKAQDGSPTIELTGTIGAGQYFLLSRSNAMVNGIPADIVYPYKNNALSNDGEYLQLLNAQGTAVDSVNASGKWPAGDKNTKQTMERVGSWWQTSQNPGGTPKEPNSAGTMPPHSESPPPSPQESIQENTQPQTPPEAVAQTQENTATTTSTLQEESQQTLSSLQTTYSDGILLNELLPAPAGPDENEEWIELSNGNNFPVNLSGWQIADTTGSVKIYTIPDGTTIAPHGFFVLPRPTTKIVLNNDHDGVVLKNPAGSIVDKVNYTAAPTGQSYGKTENGWMWSSAPTPGSPNSIPRSHSTENGERTGPPDQNKKQLAAAGKPVFAESRGESDKRLHPFLIAAAAALFSGIAILAVKRKLTEE